jgi:hypothetical protein
MGAVTAFRGVVRSEGSSGNLRVSVPVGLGVAAPAWYAAQVGEVRLLVFVRAPPSRPYPTFTLPAWAFPGLAAGASVDVELTLPERAGGQRAGFDWLPFVPEEKCFPTQDGADLVLHSQYGPPSRVHRTPARPYRLLGYYQAEGSKADTGVDWSFASSLLAPAQAASTMLAAWGIEPARCYAEVLHGPDEAPAHAQAYFAPLGLDVAAVRPRTGRGGHAVVIHVRSSSLLREMTLRALRDLAVTGFPSPEDARDYALGWLDGDGGVTIETSIRLTLAGLEYEHLIVQEAFRVAFGWERRGRGWQDNKQGTHIRLRLAEVAQLLDAGAFPYSMSRVKLLLAFDARTAYLRAVAEKSEPFRLNGLSSAVRQGLLERAPVRGYQVSASGARLVEAHARLRAEIEAVRAVAPPGGIVHRKGVAYPT